MPAAIDAGRLPKNGRPLYSQMESLGLLMDGKPTRGALLAMGRNPLAWIPGAYVQFLRLQGSGVAGPIKTRKEFTGKLVHVLKHVADLVDVVTQMSVDIASASREIQWYDYPPAAIRQLVRNAVMHRNYQASAPVRIYWFDDKLTIESPWTCPDLVDG